MNNIELTTKKVGEIKGLFFIPSYQRGYRWGENEVKRLIEDIMESKGEPYCLQPIVVRNNGDKFELVDGQQRLTTLFLIYKYLHKFAGVIMKDAKFSLEYKTREKSKDYLANIDLSRREENIDFWFIAKAYEFIDHYFDKEDEDGTMRMDLYHCLQKSVNVIWYEIPAEEDANRLFTRLNIGKIPLTCSELVKALFLREGGKLGQERQEEIALQWDNMERELQDESLWAFLTNADVNHYATRIDLILDLMAGKESKEKDDYFTFFHFDKMRREKSLNQIWQDIQHTFLTLREWRYRHELYHKIGYLIASGSKTLREIYINSKDKTKDIFENYLDNEIGNSVNFGNLSYKELTYEKNYKEIERLLFLFNVESVRTADNQKQWFPFDKHKSADWSLEHIHAQHSEGLQTNEKRKLWLTDHIASLKSLNDEKATPIIKRMEKLTDDMEKNSQNVKVKDEFEEIQPQVCQLLSPTGDDRDYLHSLSNMALISCGDNAALSNYVFDTKRRIIIKWDKEGKYIPFCTKMVFFKYYSDEPTEHQIHFWSENDRKAYVTAIGEKLKNYLSDVTEETEED